MKRALFIFVCLLCVIPSRSRSQSPGFQINEIYPVDASHSYVGFTITYMGYAKVRGRFADFRGSLRYSDKDLTRTSITFSLKSSSIDTESEWRDKDLRSANWLDAEKFPEIGFTSTKAERTAQGVTVTGILTLHGVSKNIAVPLTTSGVLKDVRGDSQVIFNGEFVINRKDFGVEGKNWSQVKEGITAVADEVKIELTILGKQFNEANFRNFVRNPSSPQGQIYKAASTEGAAKGLEVFEGLRKTNSAITADALNTAGYMLLKEGKVDAALELLRRNTEVFPNDGNAFDSYGEALAVAGKWSEAKKNYALALEKEPDNVNAKEVLRHLGD